MSLAASPRTVGGCQRQISGTLHAMSAELIAIIAASVAIIGFLWTLHRDVSDLRERMARLEGLFEGFTRGETTPRGK